ncbi:MAG: flagellar basal body P-ring formation chaperone FlgA [Silicimonas sp.]|nr:flagellar basal body P-ring formation chaperone FlgA [Silicimonas sp.]
MMRPVLLIALLATLPVAAVAETLTATRLVRPQTIIGPGDLGVMAQVIPGALRPEDDIVGLEARITLYPGRPILPNHVGPAALVERNQPVVVFFKQGGLTIATDGRALSRGAEGDIVRVMNLASRHTVSGKVQPDGSVVVLSREITR